MWTAVDASWYDWRGPRWGTVTISTNLLEKTVRISRPSRAVLKHAFHTDPTLTATPPTMVAQSIYDLTDATVCHLFLLKIIIFIFTFNTLRFLSVHDVSLVFVGGRGSIPSTLDLRWDRYVKRQDNFPCSVVRVDIRIPKMRLKYFQSEKEEGEKKKGKRRKVPRMKR